MHALEDLVSKTKRDGTKLIFSGVRPQLNSILTQNGRRAKLADVKIVPDIDSALREASLYLQGS
jgi:MFS superfamily sulfate permease-like transporter